MGKVVQFPYGEISNPIDDDHRDPILDHAQEIIHEAVAKMYDLGYDVKDEKILQDLGVITNLLVGTLMRAYDRDHFMHEVLDELYAELDIVRAMLDDLN